jgi:ATP-dependent DNA helicase RecG
MTNTEIRTRLAQIDRPLQYATRNNFAHLAKLRDLERYVQHHVHALQALKLPSPLPPLLQQLLSTVQGFDTLPLPRKQERLRQLHRLLAHMRAIVQPVAPDHHVPHQMPRSPEDPLTQPIQFVRGVGPKRAAQLKKLHLHTVNDLLWCLPIRYEDRRQITPLGLLQPGKRQTFCGTVAAHHTHPRRRGKAVFTLLLQDDSGPLTCKWFQTRGTYLQERYPVGTRVVGSGLVTLNPYTTGREVVHPDLEILEDNDMEDTGRSSLLHVGRLVPIYPLTAGLHQKTMRTLMKSVVDTYVPHVQDILPEAMRTAHALPSLPEALRQVHFPDADIDVQRLNNRQTPFHHRLVFEEFFLLELGLAIRHRTLQQERRAVPYQHPNHLGEALLRHLPFRLTAAQHRVLLEILADMQRPFPMNRLIQGDVGSGKTVVALLAMLMAVSNGFQVALMAPTEILAEQHLMTLQELLRPLKLEVVLLTSAIKGKSRQDILARIARGEVRFIVGTHALIYEEVQFHRLGMIVVDEQHRFGVLQRARLRRKGLTPDVLVMTATPIPRTLAMTLYGDLDLSVIDELPPDRLPVHTRVLSAAHRERAYDAVRREVAKGHQAYIVYPLVEESESLDLAAAVEMAKHLQHDVFPEWKVGLLHGRMPPEDKEAVMQAFKRGALDILVCTTVIEVGVDVSNATVMVIENAERFGLAQLHQLRGRVGRGKAQSYCLLVAGQTLSKEGRQRLRVMQESTDGFHVAEQDLHIRGPGELLGTKQSGLPELQVGNLLHHGPWLEQARRAAFALLEADPDLTHPAHRALLAAMQARWRDRLELAAIG